MRALIAPYLPSFAPRSGLHFLAVMASEDAADCSGLWLLLDREAPSV